MEPTKIMPVQATAVPVQQSMERQPQQAQVVSADGMDFAAFSNLANITQLEFKQGNVFWEAVSGGAMPNSYMVKERNSGQAIFLMQEESDCWCRVCCSPSQPAYVKFFNSSPPQLVPERGCCCFKIAAHNRFNKIGAPVLTFEKTGLCDNFAQFNSTNCCVWMACCQSEAWMHTGNINTTYSRNCCVDHWEFPAGKPGQADKTNMFAHAIVPIGGGCLTPTVNLMSREGMGAETQFAVIEGPTFFGGCMDLCCRTEFSISSQAGKSGNLGIIRKKTPEGSCGMCVALCSPADTYNLDFTQGNNLTPKQKAAILGEMIHLDFLFFEADQPICRLSEDGKVCYILLCTCYCMGALCPVQCCCCNPPQGGG